MNRTILLIEDDDYMQQVIRMALEDEGYRVTVARDGLQALKWLEVQAPELIVLDWMMPRLNGPAFVEELRRRGRGVGVPILVVTADGRAEQKAALIGAQGYLSKPFELDVLLDEVARLTAA